MVKELEFAISCSDKPDYPIKKGLFSLLFSVLTLNLLGM
jgi:hypothetical protein